MAQGDLLWSPSAERMKRSNMTAFMAFVNERHDVSFQDYDDLYRWSINAIPDFWRASWHFSGIVHSASPDTILDNAILPGARWFTGARLNFAENLLRYRDERVALVSWQEHGARRQFTYTELYAHVAKLARWMRSVGIGPGDRVAGFLPNIPEAVIAMLAATSIGAVWSSCSPDFGQEAAVDRFGQIEPRLLFTADSNTYLGARHDSLAKARAVRNRIPSISLLIVIDSTETLSTLDPGEVAWREVISNDATSIEFTQLPFEHPVYILYSSGTTGKPKCIVHGAGGTLLQHYKELALHTDLKRADTIFYYTTCGWMMWNWLVSALSIGATVVLYDGSPAYPSLEVLWRAIEFERITVFGVSPKYLSACQKAGLTPSTSNNFSSLKTILSTGSPLPPESFEWVYKHVKTDLQLSSISGGTDIVSCFMLGTPLSPVFSGEIQRRGLGMKVEVFDDEGRSVIDQVGELVCTAPFPSMPIGFWNDAENSKYRAAYFNRFPGVWCHGDYISINSRGGVVVYGRSDTTLNPGGVRIGAAEIYNPLETMPEILDSIVVGQNFRSDVRIVLFVVLRAELLLDDNLRGKIRETIRESATPRHVPAIIAQVGDIPRTISGKKVELVVARIINGLPLGNLEALSNPECLTQFANLPELRR